MVAFYSAKNIPGINNFMPLELGSVEVEEIFCSGEVKFHSQPIGLIVAESFELANRATAMVDVCYEGIRKYYMPNCYLFFSFCIK